MVSMATRSVILLENGTSPLLSTRRRMAKVLTKYIFIQAKHVCFFTSVPCLATLGAFVPG